MARNTRQYQDIDLNLTAHPVTGDVTLKYDEEAIKGSIRNLLLTSHFERPFHSEIGSKIKAALFEPITPMIYGILKQETINVLTAYEPRVTVLDVIVTYLSEQNTVNINIIFQLNGTSLVMQTNIPIERTR